MKETWWSACQCPVTRSPEVSKAEGIAIQLNSLNVGALHQILKGQTGLTGRETQIFFSDSSEFSQNANCRVRHPTDVKPHLQLLSAIECR